MSPTELTLAEARRRGYMVAVVEKWIAPAKRRVDLFGCIDVLAMSPTELLGIQCCRDGDLAEHRTKCLSELKLATWLAERGRRFEIWGWQTRRSEAKTKAGTRSKRLVHHLRAEEIKLGDFVPAEPEAKAGAVG